MARKESNPILGKLGQWFPGLAVFAKCLGLMYSKRSMLKQLGYIESVKERRPCRKDGSPIPWMNYNIISFLEDRLNADMVMFEYGSGNSTQFYAQHVKELYSLEKSQEWYDYNVANVPDHVTMMYAETNTGKDYAGMIGLADRQFNVVVIDAADRIDCVAASVGCLTDDGVIILDDSSDTRYQRTFESMKDKGFRRLDFEGLKPAGIRAYRSSVFYRPDNCLGI
ncbi:MAG: hypothetical protein KJP03_02860 [Gammaproteobacteria bacterium]|nr:hypothetical protein [Gammaproteobacteria bacterium]